MTLIFSTCPVASHRLGQDNMYANPLVEYGKVIKRRKDQFGSGWIRMDHGFLKIWMCFTRIRGDSLPWTIIWYSILGIFDHQDGQFIVPYQRWVLPVVIGTGNNSRVAEMMGKTWNIHETSHGTTNGAIHALKNVGLFDFGLLICRGFFHYRKQGWVTME